MSLATLKARLNYDGGDQLGRINKQKLRSMRAALKNDYQSRSIETPSGETWQCLINKDNLKPDYDNKILSIEFDSKLQAGDVFKVKDDETRWMVYLQELIETAYLRTSIRRCRYNIKINDQVYWMYFQGPVETKIEHRLNRDLSWNDLNYTGTLYVKNTPDTVKFFKRFKKIKINGETWEVQVADRISVVGIIEVELKEYYDNIDEDLPEVTKEEPIAEIVGKTIVRPESVIGYEIDKDLAGEWRIDNNEKVLIKEAFPDRGIVSVEILKDATGSFDLFCGAYSLHVEIDAVAPEIAGKTTLYPYDTASYTFLGPEEGTWKIDSSKAKVVKSADKICEIEITSGRSGEFNLKYIKIDGQEVILPITIESL